MNLKTTKKTEDIVLENIVVELEVADKTVNGITLRDRAGRVLVVRGTGYGSGIIVMVPSSPKLVRRYEVKGALRGTEFLELYNYETEALARVKEIGTEADPISMQAVLVHEE